MIVPVALKQLTHEWCCCGNPVAAFTAIRDYLQERADWMTACNNNEIMSNYVLKDMDGKDYFMAYVLDRYQLTEHGGSVGGCWLTKEGKEVLELLNSLDYDGLYELGDTIDDERYDDNGKLTYKVI